MAHISELKKKKVKEFEHLVKEYPIIGAVNMENLPAKQLQNMRATMRDMVVLRMTKRRLMKVAIENSKEKKGIDKLLPYLKGMPALLFTKENPFKLYKTIKKSKSSAPAKAGQTAPKNITVPAGPTGFAPGPIISELAEVGIKSGVDAGKVVIKEDSVVAKEGDIIKDNLAKMLTRLKIEPMEVGLELTAVYENGAILDKTILDIDEDRYLADVKTIASECFNLAIHLGIPNNDTINMLVTKAFNDSKSLSIETGILTEETVQQIIAKAESQASSVSGLIKP